MDPSDLTQAAATTIERWRAGGPALFAAEALGVTPSPQQEQASRALVERRRVSIASGHGTGKSAFLSWSILWFLCTRFPAKVPCTAPTSHQLNDILWSELARWHRVLRERMQPLGDQFEWTAEIFRLKSHPQESFAVARTSRPEQPEALQGFHSPNLLFLVDEASGIPDQVFEVAEGALSSDGAYVLMVGNPTRMSGYFYDSHHSRRAGWCALRWNGEDSPLVSRDYIADMRARYGEDSAIYKIRVLGEFAGAADGVIALSLIEPAIGRDIKPDGDIIWGLDVARFGADRTALAKRHGNVLLEPIKAWNGKDTMQTAGLLKLEYDAAHKKPECINIDVIGIGAGVVDRCKEMGLPVRGVNVAEMPSMRDRFNRLRDELWFAAREWFEGRNCSIPDDQTLIAELTLPAYRVLSSGKIQVESKEELRRRGVVSPDYADAFCLTFANVGVRPGGFRRRIDWHKYKTGLL